ncbi:MAG: ABC transporter permease [Acidobacteriota bacterium]
MESLWNDLRLSVRSLLKNSGFTFVAILSLAIGIGANSAIFSVANALLLRPLAYQDADRLVILWNRSPGLNVERDWFSPGQYLDIKAENQVFDEVAVTIGVSFNLSREERAEHVDGARVSSSFFSVFDARPYLGRVLLPEEDEPGKPQTVVLSHQFWQQRMGGDPDVIGQSLKLNGNNFQIVGVMSQDFSINKEVMPAVNGIERVDLLLPLPMSKSARTNRGNEDFNIFARLKPGASIAEAQAEMDALAARMKREYPEAYPPDGGLTITVHPLLEQVVGEIRFALYVLLGAVAFVLLIACANVANLLLARASARQREIAIRAAVGASRFRIIRQMLTESALLALMGGAVGLALAIAAIKVLRAIGPDNIPRLDEVGIDGRVMAFTFFISLATALIFGLAPAVRASRVDLNESLKESGRSSGHSQHRIRRLLVMIEVALSLVLLIGAGLLIRSYQRIANAHPGFDPHNVLSFRLLLPASRYQTPEAILSFHKRARERIKSLPGVESVAVTYSLPMSSVAFAWEPITIEGYAPRNAQDFIISNTRIVSPDYFRVMKIPLIAGRYFDEQDRQGRPEAVIVDEAMAARFWPNDNPLGKRLRIGKDGPWRMVVGVVSGAKEYSAEKEPPIAVYYPFEQRAARNVYMVARASSDAARMSQAIIGEIQALDPELALFDVRAMEERLYDSLARRRFALLLLTIFAAFALMLAVTGIYGVMSYWVNQRTKEIGIRSALGAGRRRIVWMVIGQAAIMVSIGVAAGLAGAFALTRVLSSLLFGISATDSLTFVALSIALGGAALMASYLPARRAAKVDPIVALRCE